MQSYRVKVVELPWKNEGMESKVEASRPTLESLIGKTVTVEEVVSPEMTARTVGSGGLDVLSTPSMILMMERAAYECLLDGLGPDQTSVGTKVEITHEAPSPVGALVSATATIEQVFGRRIEFAVSASEGTRVIGKGKHTRFVVDLPQFLQKAGLARTEDTEHP